MGFRFHIEDANWLALLLQPALRELPELSLERRYDLAEFLESFEYNFYSHGNDRGTVRLARQAAALVRDAPTLTPAVLEALRHDFRSVAWVALLLPGGNDPPLDQFLTDREFLLHLVNMEEAGDCWILQLTQVPAAEQVVSFVSKAFQVALNAADEWPGMLVWRPRADARFFPLGWTREQVVEQCEWLMKGLARHTPLQTLVGNYEASPVAPPRRSTLTLLHMSDLHLGKRRVEKQLLRAKQLVRNVFHESPTTTRLVPVVTGDVMDSPSLENARSANDFIDFLYDLSTEPPLVLLGNHDVRANGYGRSLLDPARRLPRSPLVLFPEEGVVLVAFDSTQGSDLARGRIGNDQMIQLGNTLDRDDPQHRYSLVALLHHHPIPVDDTQWKHLLPWYERMAPAIFERTLLLEDAQPFLAWLQARRCVAALHGHKHIPRVDTQKGIHFIGCGSTTGNVPNDSEGRTYLSMNIVSVDAKGGQITCRLRAEQYLGAGTEEDTHELLFRGSMPARVDAAN